MPNQISTVGFGSPYASEQMDIQRKQKLAQLLQQQALTPIEQGATPPGGFTPRTSPLQGLAKIMQGYVGQQREKGAQTQQTELAQRMQQERQQALAQAMMQGQGSPQPAPEQGGGPAMPPNPMGAAQGLAGANDPALQQAGLQMIGKQMEAQMPQRPPNPQQMAFQQQEAEAKRQATESAAGMASADRLQREQAARQQQGDMARLTASLRPDPMATKPPPGYRPSAAGDLEAIPGGPADMKLKGQFNQDTGILQASTSGLDRLGAEANALLNHPGLSKSTGLMSVVPGVGGLASIPGTDAANFKARLDTLKSQVGFSVLQEMRNNSKTGGALGQVSDRENVMLQNNLAALDRAQSEPEFKEALKRIVTYTDAAKDRLRGAFNMKHGDVQEQTPQRRSTDKPASKLTPQEQQELDALRKRFGR